MNQILLAHEWEQEKAVVNTAVKLRVPKTAGNY